MDRNKNKIMAASCPYHISPTIQLLNLEPYKIAS